MLEALKFSEDKDSPLSDIDIDGNNVDSENDDAFLARYKNDGNFTS